MATHAQLKVVAYSFSLGVKNHLSQLPTCNLCFPKHSYDTQTPFRGIEAALVQGSLGVNGNPRL